MLFNKNNAGPAELQELLGIYYQTNRYSVIATEIELAESDVRRMVGKTLFERAEAHYNSPSFEASSNDLDSKIVRAIQLPVAALAVYRFYQQNTVGHEDEGRKVKLDKENESIPWKWQIEMDNKALLDRYYRLLDAMYLFFEENNIPEWSEAPILARLKKSLVRSLAEFQEVFPIENSYYLFYLLVPFMIEAQDRAIMPVVGNENFMKIIDGITTEDDLREIVSAAKKCIPLYAIQTAVKRMSVRILPDAIVRRFSASFQGGKADDSADIATTRYLLHTLEEETTAALTELQTAVTKRRNVAAEYDPLPENNPRNKYFTAG